MGFFDKLFGKKEKEDLNKARQDRKDIINQNKIDDVKDKQDRIQAGKDAAKQELDIIKDNQKSATELLKEESQRQIDAVQAKYEEQIRLAKKYGKDIKDLEEARDKELKDITDRQVDLSRGGNEQIKIATISSIKTTKAFQEQQKAGLVGVQEVRERIFQREKEIDEAKRKNQQDALSATANTLGQVADLFGRESAAGKAAAIAQATIDTYLSAQKAYTSTIGVPVVGPVLAPISAGLAIAAGIKNIKAIAAVKTPGPDVPVPNINDVSAASPPQAPNFNVVGNSGMNQLAQIQQQPMQAYVVSSSVTTAQSLDRNRIENATL
jgi:hypothetical protein